MMIKTSLQRLRAFFLGLVEGAAISAPRLEDKIENGRP